MRPIIVEDYNGRLDPAQLASLLLTEANDPSSQLERQQFFLHAQEKKQALLKDWRSLRDIISRHELTIQKRWVKKSKAQRLKVLLDAWPGMPPHHRPDFWALRLPDKEFEQQIVKFKYNFLLPFINREDLSRPRNLLLLINSRGRHSPAEFAGSDVRFQELGRATKAIESLSIELYTMVLNDVGEQDLERRYGSLLSWRTSLEAVIQSQSRRQFRPGEGLLVLDAQQKLYEFLVRCCHIILQDIPPEALTGEMYLVQPEPPMIQDKDGQGYDSLATMASEAPYRLPRKVDFRRIEATLSARASAAQDHLWQLREDPTAFREALTTLDSHSLERLTDNFGRQHPSTYTNVYWQRLLGSLVSDLVVTADGFTDLSKHAQNVRTQYERFADQLSPAEDLPHEFMASILGLRIAVEYGSKHVLTTIAEAALSSPPWKRLCVRHDLDENGVAPMIRYNAKMTDQEDHLWWLLSLMGQDGKRLSAIGLPLVLDELDRLLSADPHLKTSMISPYLARLIADLSTINQVSEQVDLLHPWSRMFKRALKHHPEVRKASDLVVIERYKIIDYYLNPHRLANAVQHLEPFKSPISYPILKQRTEANVELLRQAEANLDKLWQSIDELILQDQGANSSRLGRDLLATSRSIQRTPPWDPVADLPKKKTKPKPVLVATKTVPIEESMARLLAEPLDEGVVQQQAKVKTRGAAAEPEAGAEEAAKSSVDDVPPPPRIEVDARALKVFHNLFYAPNASATPGEIPWTDFCYAMTHIGFTAVKGYGSAWNFYPERIQVARSIQFHEPHPKVKIPYEVARGLGRRLTKNYQWNRETFVLRERAAKGSGGASVASQSVEQRVAA